MFAPDHECTEKKGKMTLLITSCYKMYENFLMFVDVPIPWDTLDSIFITDNCVFWQIFIAQVSGTWDEFT